MSLKIRKKELMRGIILYFLFNTPYCFGYISNSKIMFYFTMFIGVLLTGFVLVEAQGKVKKELKFGIDAFIVPYFLVTAMSFMTGLGIYHLSIKPYISQSFLLMVEQWTTFLVAYYLYRREKERSIRLVTITGVISYTTVIIRYILVAGVDGIVHPFNHRVSGIGLEVHGLTYTFVLIVLYYLFTKGYKYILKNKLLWIVIIYIFLGNKRAAYLGAVIAVVLYYLIASFGKRKKLILGITTFLMLFCMYIYIFVIHSGYLQAVAAYFGITDSFRFNFWNYFKNCYNISPLYSGRTLFYTDYYMTLPEIHKMYNFGGQGQMHNDILRMYIGWGFIPFFYYYLKMFVINIKQLEKKNIMHAGWKFFPIICFFTVIEGFDNMLGTLHFNMLVYLTFFLFIEFYNKNFEVKRKELSNER